MTRHAPRPGPAGAGDMGLFTIDRDGAVPGEDGSRVVPVAVDVRERPAHRFGFGTGVSSNTGARVTNTRSSHAARKPASTNRFSPVSRVST